MNIGRILINQISDYQKTLTVNIVDDDLNAIKKRVINIETICDIFLILLNQKELKKQNSYVLFLQKIVNALNYLLFLYKSKEIRENVLLARNKIAELILKLEEED